MTQAGARVIVLAELRAKLGHVSRATLLRRRKAPDFPKPFEISPGVLGYREDEVDAWLARQRHVDLRKNPDTHNAAARDAGRDAFWEAYRRGDRERATPREKAHRDAAAAEVASL